MTSVVKVLRLFGGGVPPKPPIGMFFPPSCNFFCSTNDNVLLVVGSVGGITVDEVRECRGVAIDWIGVVGVETLDELELEFGICWGC